MDLKDMRTAAPDALARALLEAQAKLRHLQGQLAANQLKQVREVRSVRRQIARLKTILQTHKAS